MDSFLKNIMQLAILTIYNIYNKNYFRKKLVPPSLIFELVFGVYIRHHISKLIIAMKFYKTLKFVAKFVARSKNIIQKQLFNKLP